MAWSRFSEWISCAARFIIFFHRQDSPLVGLISSETIEVTVNLNLSKTRSQFIHISYHLSWKCHKEFYKQILCWSLDSGGSWGLVVLGPAILWGPLQWWAPTFASWGRWKPLRRDPRQSPGGKRILATTYWKLAENQISWSPSTPIIPNW